MKHLTGRELALVVAMRPQYAARCDLSHLSGSDWVRAYLILETRCLGLTEIPNFDAGNLNNMQEYIEFCDWSKLSKKNQKDLRETMYSQLLGDEALNKKLEDRSSLCGCALKIAEI